MSDKIENFMDFIKRGKFVTLGELWNSLQDSEKAAVLSKISTLAANVLNRLKYILAISNKSFYNELFDNEGNIKSSETVAIKADEFALIKEMIVLCKTNPTLLDLFVNRVVNTQAVEEILPIVKEMDEDIYNRIIEQINKKNEILSKEDPFDCEILNSDFLQENIIRCKIKAKILSSYYRELAKGNIDNRIIESLMMQESYLLEDSNDNDQSFAFGDGYNNDDDDDNDDNFRNRDDDDDDEYRTFE